MIEREYKEIFAVLERAKHRPPSSESSAIAAQALLVLAPVLSTRGPFEAFSIWLSPASTAGRVSMILLTCRSRKAFTPSATAV